MARRFTRRNTLALRPVHSIKNSFTSSGGLTSGVTSITIAKAVDAPAAASTPEEVNHGSTIRAMHITLDICGLGGSGVLNSFNGFLFKNPGANLTPPSPGSVGTSNEKKFVCQEWSAMIMRNQDGNPPLHWEGWYRLPRRYHRMGTDDIWQISMKVTSALTGHYYMKIIYKWFD